MKCLTDKEVRLQRLEDAAIAVHRAVDSRGLKILLCSDPMNIVAVRHSLGLMARWFRYPLQTAWLDDGGELAAVRNLKLLAALLEAHLAAGK